MFEVNALEKQCPIPLIMTKNAIAQNGNGEYKIFVDNEIAVQNLEKLAKQYSFDFDFEKITNTKYEVRLNVLDTSKVVATKINQDLDINSKTDKCVNSANSVVVFKSEFMGQGDLDLGRILSKGCIYAISQLDDPPKTIMFYNSGVKLACEGSDNLEDLDLLEKKGAQIFVCGTCLMHYELQDKLKIGQVTNMYDIVERLNNAAKIIYP